MWILIIIALLVIFIPKHGSYLDDENEKLIYADSEDDSKEDDEDTIGAHDLNKNAKKKNKTKTKKTKNTEDEKPNNEKPTETTEPKTIPKQQDESSSSTRTRTTKSSNRPDVSKVKNPIKSSGIKETEESINSAQNINDRIYREGTK